jgi:translation initiation factor IF-2
LFSVDAQGNKVIQMKPPIVVRDLAARIGKKPHLLLMELMELNVFANVNESIGEDIARKICEHHGFLFDLEKREHGAGTIHRPPPKAEIVDEEDKTEDLQSRPPVVTVMGHVDHGKTSLLDAIRKTNVVADESGGITQHIGASVVVLPDGKQITFLDTPGHEAFTKMRARGANVTDIVILVVAGDDGVMPQTIEAINHAKAANVPIIIAVNKCDLPTANPDRVKKQLQEHGLSPESWGGETITVDVSATTKKNLDHLLEMILLQAEMMELKASRKRTAKGNVIEAQLEPGMGPTATVLVRKGVLRVGDAVICGPYGGKIRALVNDKGRRIKEALPSMPVKIVGLTGLPEAGAEFSVVESEKEARQLGEQRQTDARTQAAEPSAHRATLEDLMSQIEDGKKKILPIVLKADVQGSLEALIESLGKLKSDKVELNLIHAAVGSITENDVLLASASDAVIIGFRVKLESGVTDAAKRENVQIKLYAIIYELLEHAEKAMEGLLEPESRETVTGHAEVRQVFAVSKGPAVAGCMVTKGRVTRGSRVRVLRSKAVQYEGRIASLKHFQNDMKEIKTGMECGLRLENYQDFLVGDILECYTVEKVMPKL